MNFKKSTGGWRLPKNDGFRWSEIHSRLVIPSDVCQLLRASVSQWPLVGPEELKIQRHGGHRGGRPQHAVSVFCWPRILRKVEPFLCPHSPATKIPSQVTGRPPVVVPPIAGPRRPGPGQARLAVADAAAAGAGVDCAGRPPANRSPHHRRRAAAEWRFRASGPGDG